ncbi:MAG: transposase [Anaerolineaceae bacterium]|nr:transposase [Anaerolineaceae bacterium]
MEIIFGIKFVPAQSQKRREASRPTKKKLFSIIYNIDMPDYRRIFIPGATYFFTVVTYHRKPILTNPESRKILRTVWLDVQSRFPFTIDAICLLPNHIHTIWTMPENDSNFSLRWGEIKRMFSKQYRIIKASNDEIIENVWQDRFWDHMIRDEKDMENHVNYIHYNPVKHQLVNNVRDWPWSSFHRFAKNGLYDINWGSDYEQNQYEKYGE